jgi:hypothetical protein
LYPQEVDARRLWDVVFINILLDLSWPMSNHGEWGVAHAVYQTPNAEPTFLAPISHSAYRSTLATPSIVKSSCTPVYASYQSREFVYPAPAPHFALVKATAGSSNTVKQASQSAPSNQLAQPCPLTLYMQKRCPIASAMVIVTEYVCNGNTPWIHQTRVEIGQKKPQWCGSVSMGTCPTRV